MQIADAVVLVTGANRGIGLAFARTALHRAARRVHGAARAPANVQLDVTDAGPAAASLAAA